MGLATPLSQSIFRGCSYQGQKRYPKELLRQRFRRTSGELSGAICLETLVLLGSALDLFRNFFATVRAIFWVWGSFLAPDLNPGLLFQVYF